MNSLSCRGSLMRQFIRALCFSLQYFCWSSLFCCCAHLSLVILNSRLCWLFFLKISLLIWNDRRTRHPRWKLWQIVICNDGSDLIIDRMSSKDTSWRCPINLGMLLFYWQKMLWPQHHHSTSSYSCTMIRSHHWVWNYWNKMSLLSLVNWMLLMQHLSLGLFSFLLILI